MAILNVSKSIKSHIKVAVNVLLCCALSILSYYTLACTNRFHCVIYPPETHKGSQEGLQIISANHTVEIMGHYWKIMY